MQSGNRAFSVCAIFLAGGLFFSPGLRAQTSRSSSAGSGQPQTQAAPAGGSETDQLRQQLADQQKQIQALQLALQKQQQLLEELVAGKRAPVSGSAPAASQSAPSGRSYKTEGASQVASLSSTPPITKKVLGTSSHAGAVATGEGLAPAEGQTMLKPAVPRSPDLISVDGGKFRISTLFYGDWSYYYKTGFGPQFLTQLNPPGAGNDGFNSFDITRTYINFFWSPTRHITFRATPNIYRQLGGDANVKLGQTGAAAATVNGNLSLRLKYAYVDLTDLFSGNPIFGKDKITLGQETNPLIDWEERLYDYRWVNLVPWNYLSLSSTYTGVSLKGPVEANGKMYADYDIGVFTQASFHTLEQSDKKQFMGRLTVYPAGASSDFQGLGLTGFLDYGYSNNTPDTRDVPLYRLAGLVHFETRSNDYGIAGELDYGHNAFSVGNLFSGSGPADSFGFGPTQYAGLSTLAAAILGGEHTVQRGFDVFGHARIPRSPFKLFGMYEFFQPNINVNVNPLDFHRIVGGISYQFNKHLLFAADSQNLIYSHGQFTFPASDLLTLSPSLAASNSNGIPNAVPPDIQAFFLNVEFSY